MQGANNNTLNIEHQVSFNSQKSRDFLLSQNKSLKTSALPEQTDEESDPSSRKKQDHAKNNDKRKAKVLLSHTANDVFLGSVSPDGEQSDTDAKKTQTYDAESTFDNQVPLQASSP